MSSPDTTKAFIRKLDAFAPPTPPEKACLAQISAGPRFVEARADLIREGGPPDGVFLVLEGFACRYERRANGTRHVTAHDAPGEKCDLDVAVFDRMDHSIGTLSACTVVELEPDTIAALLARKQIARGLRMSTLVDEAILREWLVDVGARSALERTAHRLCELPVRLQVVGFTTGDGYGSPITQIDLANTTGPSSVHVNRSLRELRTRRLIGLKTGSPRILDLPAPKTVAEFEPVYLHAEPRDAA